MRSVIAEVDVARSPEDSWRLMRDLTLAHHYVPGVTGTRIDTAQKEGVGASRTVFLDGRAPLQETVVEWRDGAGFVIRLHQGEKPMAPFAAAQFSYGMAPAGPGRTRVRLELSYETGSLLVSILDALFLRRMLRGNVRRTAEGLKRYYESLA